MIKKGSAAWKGDLKDGTGTTTLLTLKAPTATTVQWVSGDPEEGVQFGTAIHATFTGTAPVASFEYD